MEPIQEREFGTRTRIMPTHFHLDWISVAYDELPAEMKYLVEWPRSVAEDLGAKYTSLRGRRQSMG